MITTFVQTVPRRPSWAECKASIEASDIGTDYTVLEQASHTSPRQHFLYVLYRMSAAKTPWVLRLEDDVEVNRHIRENIATWDAKAEVDFGAGWLFDPGGTTRTTHDRLYQRIGKDRWHSGELHCCQGVLLPREHIPLLMMLCNQWFTDNPGVLAQDIALSRAVCALGRRICVHAPPLVEHLIKYTSTLGHANTRSHTTEGAFRLKWKR